MRLPSAGENSLASGSPIVMSDSSNRCVPKRGSSLTLMMFRPSLGENQNSRLVLIGLSLPISPAGMTNRLARADGLHSSHGLRSERLDSRVYLIGAPERLNGSQRRLPEFQLAGVLAGYTDILLLNNRIGDLCLVHKRLLLSILRNKHASLLKYPASGIARDQTMVDQSYS